MIEIYGTLGPACSGTDTLEKMFQAGMTGIRLNLSHTTLQQAEDQIRNLHIAAERCGIAAKLLIDLQGPELRIGPLAQPLALTAGDAVDLDAGILPLPEIVRPFLRTGQQLLLDDGKILLEISTSAGKHIAKVLRGGLLKGQKSLALPGCVLSPPAITEQDKENLRLAKSYGVTGVMQPFVRKEEDLRAVRSTLDEYGSGHIKLFAKIENMDGVNNLEALIPACDEIVIARGDLGNAMPLWELPGVQKRIASLCRSAGRPFMVVTQMLASMEQSPVPTRAELSDIYNAVADGASSLMLTGETAVGAYPEEAIRYLNNCARAALADCPRPQH